jgi:hypothetical protein
MREALIAAREYIEPDTHVPWADRLLAQIDAALAAQPPAAPVENKKGDQVHWLKVNDEPFEYAIQQGSHGDEFVKLLNGECLRRPVSPFSAVTDAMDTDSIDWDDLAEERLGQKQAPGGCSVEDDDLSPAVKRALAHFWQKATQYDHEKLQAIYNDMHDLQDRVETIPLSQALDGMDLALQIIDRLLDVPQSVREKNQ